MSRRPPPPLPRPGAAAAAMLLGALAGAMQPALAQGYPPDYRTPAGPGTFPAPSQQELDRLLAPIALYPDAILSQVLMASAFPAQIAAAAQWTRQHPGLAGRAAVAAAQEQPWHPAVLSLLSTPELLLLMDERPDWTRALGAAMLEQEPLVLETVQTLRRRAQSAGTLPRELQASLQGSDVLIGAMEPAWVQLPWYDPLTVYGPWWWPLAPVRWTAWRSPGVQVFSSGFVATAPVTLAHQLPWGRFDWQMRRINVVQVHYIGTQPGYRSQAHWRHAVPVSTAWPANPAPPAAALPIAASGPAAAWQPAPGAAPAVPVFRTHPQVPPAVSSAYAGLPVSTAYSGLPVSSVHARPVPRPLAAPLAQPLAPALGTALVPSLSTPVAPTLSTPVVTPAATPIVAARPPTAAIMRGPQESAPSAAGHPGRSAPAGNAGGPRRSLMR